jgi:hypothetical protein
MTARTYKITVPKGIPPKLVERVSAIHASAIQQSQQLCVDRIRRNHADKVLPADSDSISG